MRSLSYVEDLATQLAVESAGRRPNDFLNRLLDADGDLDLLAVNGINKRLEIYRNDLADGLVRSHVFGTLNANDDAFGLAGAVTVVLIDLVMTVTFDVPIGPQTTRVGGTQLDLVDIDADGDIDVHLARGLVVRL